MPRGRGDGLPRAVLFDLDETLIAGAAAWAYTLEQAVLSVSGQRIDALALAPTYRRRPWEHAAAVVLAAGTAAQRRACAALCGQMAERSALKRLLVHEGMGMALDRLRGERVELGAVSRIPHATALKQLQSTGLDRFLTVLSATPAGDQWDVAARADDCLGFLALEPGATVFVSGEGSDLARLRSAGYAVLHALWAMPTDADGSGIAAPPVVTPADLFGALRLLQLPLE